MSVWDDGNALDAIELIAFDAYFMPATCRFFLKVRDFAAGSG
jgi:hypothetical protein